MNARTQLVSATVAGELLHDFLRYLIPTVSFDLLSELVVASSQVFTQMAHVYRLAPVLAAGNSRDNLRHNSARHLEALRRFDELSVHDGTVVQHVAHIDKTAVENRLNKIIRIMEMQNSLFMGLCNLLRQKQSFREILGNFACDQISLSGSCCRILVGILFHNLFIAVLNQAQNRIICCIGAAHQLTCITIHNISLRQIKLP